MHYTGFGILLLEDNVGARVEAIVRECRENAEEINTRILREWLQGRGRRPVCWRTLTDVLCDIGLDCLALDIETAMTCS